MISRKMTAQRIGNYLSLWFVDHGLLRLLYLNRYRLPGGFFRSNQPSPYQIEYLRTQWGIRTVLNLRGTNPERGFYKLEKEACENLRLELKDVVVWSRGLLFREQIIEIRDLIESLNLPALVHCKSGADRAGFFAVFYRHFRLGEPIEEAVQELGWRYGHFKSAQTGVLDFFFQTYLTSRRPRQSFLNWVENDYQRTPLERSFKPKGLMRFLVDFLLRRE